MRREDGRGEVRSYAGSVDDRLCRCERTEREVGLVVVTRAVCCSSRGRAVSGGVVCPPHLPHTARYRSAQPRLSCPHHSQPYKCVCLGQNKTRTQGHIEAAAGLCQCGEETRVTRLVCCHSHTSQPVVTRDIPVIKLP